MKYALIGCGRIAINHLKAAKSNKLNIVAVCDIVPGQMEKLLTACDLADDNSITRYSNHRALLESTKPDLVAIATESGSHGRLAIDCLEAGVNVIIEKPITLSLDEADQIIALADEKKLKVCASHQNRFNVAVQHLRAAIEKGRFGRLSHGCVHVRWNRNKNYYAQAPWRGTWAEDGGALMNQSIHGIDLLRWMMGDEIEEVSAYTARQFHPYLECEDVGLAVIKFKNGALGSLEGTTNIFPENLEETLYIFGENGTVKLGGKSANAIDVWRFKELLAGDEALGGLSEAAKDVYGNGHPALYADMIEAIEKNRSPYVDARAGRKALEMVLAVYKSAVSNKPVKFPLTGVSSTDFTGYFGIRDQLPS